MEENKKKNENILKDWNYSNWICRNTLSTLNKIKCSYRWWRKVIVDDEVDSLEVDAAAHQLRADQHPDTPRPARRNDNTHLSHQSDLPSFIM